MIFDLSDGEASEEEELWMPELPPELGKELFGLAHAVREMEPWKEFFDQDWYGIRDPGTGEVQVVSILGADEQVFAIQLYLPEEGIRFWNELIVTDRLNQHAGLFDLRMIECEFCGKDDLPEEDLELNELHPPTGGRKPELGYVSFRSPRPEYYPWFLDEEEGRMSLMRKSFAAMAEQTGYLPGILIVGSPLAEVAFGGLAASSGMQLEPVRVLPQLTGAIGELMGSLGDNGLDEMGVFLADDPGEGADPNGPK